MSIVQGQTTQFKVNLLSGLENFSVGTPYTYKLALYNANANLNNTTLIYTSTNETTGGSYVAGGQILVISTINIIFIFNVGHRYFILWRA